MTRRPRLTYAPKGLQLTDEEFHALHERAGKVRKGSRAIPVPVEALRHLLHDHSALYARLEEVDRHLRSPEAGKSLQEPPRPANEAYVGKGVQPASRRKHPLVEVVEEEDLIG